MNAYQFDLFKPPAIERAATIPSGAVFFYAGRPLRVYRVYGNDARAPVIVEELAQFGTALKGQYALWSQDAVARALSGASPCR
jgi:hypothetical protein